MNPEIRLNASNHDRVWTKKLVLLECNIHGYSDYVSKQTYLESRAGRFNFRTRRSLLEVQNIPYRRSVNSKLTLSTVKSGLRRNSPNKKEGNLVSPTTSTPRNPFFLAPK